MSENKTKKRISDSKLTPKKAEKKKRGDVVFVQMDEKGDKYKPTKNEAPGPSGDKKSSSE